MKIELRKIELKRMATEIVKFKRNKLYCKSLIKKYREFNIAHTIIKKGLSKTINEVHQLSSKDIYNLIILNKIETLPSNTNRIYKYVDKAGISREFETKSLKKYNEPSYYNIKKLCKTFLID